VRLRTSTYVIYELARWPRCAGATWAHRAWSQFSWAAQERPRLAGSFRSHPTSH